MEDFTYADSLFDLIKNLKKINFDVFKIREDALKNISEEHEFLNLKVLGGTLTIRYLYDGRIKS